MEPSKRVQWETCGTEGTRCALGSGAGVDCGCDGGDSGAALGGHNEKSVHCLNPGHVLLRT